MKICGLFISILAIFPVARLHRESSKELKIVECDYFIDKTGQGGYTSQCQNLKLIEDDEEVRFTGKRLSGTSNEDVVTLHIDISSTVNFIPSTNIFTYYPNLRRLDMHNIAVKKITYIVNCFPLEYINLDGNQINQIDADVFTDCEILEVLKIKMNEINKIHDNAFGPLRNLIELDLSYNKIEIITRKMLNPMKKLQKLDLLWNAIKIFSADNFNDLHNLKFLDLSVNPLTGVDHRQFDFNVNLETFHVSGTQIRKFPVGIFRNLRRLRFLDISNNQLRVLDGDLLKYNTDLEDLNIDKTSLKYLGSNFFDKISRISVVHARQNACIDGVLAGNVYTIRPQFLKCMDNYNANSSGHSGEEF